jgi:tRNA(fMet)-specific endonuclease VapC
MTHLDSSFLIDLLREQVRERPGAAFDFIESLDPTEVLAVSVHVLCELRAGAELTRRPLAEHETLDRLLSGLLVVYPDERFAAAYGRLYAATSRRATPMSAMDLLIATSAILDDASLVTKNVRDFSRVPGLRLLEY